MVSYHAYISAFAVRRIACGGRAPCPPPPDQGRQNETARTKKGRHRCRPSRRFRRRASACGTCIPLPVARRRPRQAALLAASGTGSRLSVTGTGRRAALAGAVHPASAAGSVVVAEAPSTSPLAVFFVPIPKDPGRRPRPHPRSRPRNDRTGHASRVQRRAGHRVCGTAFAVASPMKRAALSDRSIHSALPCRRIRIPAVQVFDFAPVSRCFVILLQHRCCHSPRVAQSIKRGGQPVDNVDNGDRLGRSGG